MPANPKETTTWDEMPPAMALHTLLLVLLAVLAGTFAAVVLLPTWVPALGASFSGSGPKAYWYISRASAGVAYGLLWFSMALGLTITNKMARLWPGGPVAFDLHQHASLLGLVFALFHAIILTGDKYIDYTLVQVLTPFASVDFKPLWVGLGQIAFYLLAVVSLSFYVRGIIGRRLWRLVHYLSFVVFLLAMLHGVMSGTDSELAWVSQTYWLSGSTLLFLTIYRLLSRAFKSRPKRGRSSARTATPPRQRPVASAG